MGRFIDLTGQKFNKLTVIRKIGVAKNRQSIWLCRCDCGNKKEIVYGELTKKYHPTKSCGCLLKENGCPPRHNLSRTRLYCIYNQILKRCYNKTNKDYKNYGSRGIKVCDEWNDKENGILNFYNWAMENGYKDDLSIDRIDVNGNYEPNNCRWATIKEQCNNKRNSHYITYNSETHTIAEWSEILNIGYSTIQERIKQSLPLPLIFYKGRINLKIKAEYKN